MPDRRTCSVTEQIFATAEQIAEGMSKSNNPEKDITELFLQNQLAFRTNMNQVLSDFGYEVIERDGKFFAVVVQQL
ncbi:MAG: hypothetical protein WC774_01310 [Candidatus Gracilibacteria bacterium]|jgi:hypothetical protein